MPEIFIDGECIEFSGPPPETMAALVSVLDPVLAGAGRVLAEIKIDGSTCPDEFGALGLAGAKRVEVFSMPLAQAVARVAAGCSETTARLHAEGDTLANDVLRESWVPLRGRCLEFAEKVGRLLQDAGALAPHMTASGGQSDALPRVVGELEQWLDGVQAGDAAEVCLHLHRGLLPALQALKDAADTLARGAAS